MKRYTDNQLKAMPLEELEKVQNKPWKNGRKLVRN